MKKYLVVAISLLLFAAIVLVGRLAFAPSLAETVKVEAENLTRVIFSVENMTCGTCPITVKTAMSRVEGVSSVDIDFKVKTATVVFDPSVTTVEAIAAASINAGYPARPASN